MPIVSLSHCGVLLGKLNGIVKTSIKMQSIEIYLQCSIYYKYGLGLYRSIQMSVAQVESLSSAYNEINRKMLLNTLQFLSLDFANMPNEFRAFRRVPDYFNEINCFNRCSYSANGHKRWHERARTHIPCPLKLKGSFTISAPKTYWF